MELIAMIGEKQVALVSATARGALRLDYAPGQRLPVSLSLPTATRTHTGEPVRRWLDGLLPEKPEARQEIARLAGTSPTDLVGMLAVVGHDCPGAVRFVPRGQSLVLEARAQPASDADIEARLAEMTTARDSGWLMAGEHWSLGGYQDKFTLLRRDGRWFFPTGDQPSTHIVKPGVHDLSAQAMVEHVSMRTAARLGIDVAPTQFVDFGAERAIVIERFDRRRVGGDLERVPHEDLCQAMGEEHKYEAQGGPGVARIAAFLREHSATRGQANTNIDRLCQQVVVNVLLGAPDAHARNMSVLLEGEGAARMAPMYDVASGLPYDTRGSRTLSMSVGGTADMEAVDAAAWTGLAADLGVAEDLVIDRVRSWAAELPDAMNAALEEVDDWNGHDSEVVEAKQRLERRLPEHLARIVP